MTVTTEALDDGSVRVCVGDVCGTVSSWHLVEPKINQLKKHESRAIASAGSDDNRVKP